MAVSVGFESGNQRILNLIDKGTTPAQVKQTIEAMHAADIGVQMLGFTGFPTETFEEARDSIDFLVDNRELWTFGGLGDFVLTLGLHRGQGSRPLRPLQRPARPGRGRRPMRWTMTSPSPAAAREAVAREKRRLRTEPLRPALAGRD